MLHYQTYLVQDTTVSKGGTCDAGWLATCNCGQDFWMAGTGTKADILNLLNHHLANANVMSDDERDGLSREIIILKQRVETQKRMIEIANENNQELTAELEESLEEYSRLCDAVEKSQESKPYLEHGYTSRDEASTFTQEKVKRKTITYTYDEKLD